MFENEKFIIISLLQSFTTFHSHYTMKILNMFTRKDSFAGAPFRLVEGEIEVVVEEDRFERVWTSHFI